MRVEARIAAAAAAHAALPAMEGESGERLSYGELEHRVEQLARHLARLGAVPGARVALVFENDWRVPVALLAVFRCGACAVPLNARLADIELDALLAHADPKLVLMIGGETAAAGRHATRLGARAPEEFELTGTAVLACAAREEEALPGDVAVLLYTSGSTGRPKGVMLTHGNLDFLLATGAAQRWLVPEDRVLAVLPMSHSFGLTSVAFSALAAGACLLPRAGFDAARVAEMIVSRRVTALLGVPAMYAKLAEHAHETGMRLQPNALRLASVGGAPLEAALQARYEQMLGLRLNGGYGLTEAAPTVTRGGVALPGVELRIRDLQSGADAPAGAVGVLLVRGPNVMRGYYKDAAATAAAIDAAGWLDTGDLARLDEEGQLLIVGRLKEIIIRSGFNVYPQEVEQAICAHPEVAAAAVLGRMREGNEDVVAFVALRPGAQVDAVALRGHLKPRIAAYKIPTVLILREALPMLASGKVDKLALRHELGARPTP